MDFIQYLLFLIEENDLSSSKNSLFTPLNDVSKENSLKGSTKEIHVEKKYNNLTKEEIRRLEELRLMKVKCLIYPSVTSILWTFASIYRIADTIILWRFDHGGDDNIEDERDYFEKHQILHFFVESFLVLHTILSSIRGIFYGLSFVVFEENIFFNFFRRFMDKFFKDEDLTASKEGGYEEGEEKKIIRNTTNSSSTFEYNENKNKNDNENQENEEKSESVEMNNSDYYYNE